MKLYPKLTKEEYDNCQKTEGDEECFHCHKMNPKYAYCKRLYRINGITGWEPVYNKINVSL